MTSVQPIQLLKTEHFYSRSNPLRGTTRVNCVGGKMQNIIDQQREAECFTVRDKEAKEREKVGGQREESRFYTNLSGDSALTKKIS